LAEVPAGDPQEETLSADSAETTPQGEDADDATPDSAPVSANSLQQLIARQATSAPLSRELNCLAGAIYFESKSEPLLGQLAVGRVIVARSRSGRFPNSYCGVVYQPSQFSFVRGGGMPPISKGSQDWKEAVAIAQIAHEGSWKSPVEGALFFHAARVSPGWRLARVGKLGNHVFYR
jgi:spore germination cell wall hydrolase CwlJ-like protein